ncbi:MAG: transglycosylase domain-containing protein [bacterium]
MLRGPRQPAGGRVVAGGSTITQQVVQLRPPQAPRSVWGKAKGGALGPAPGAGPEQGRHPEQYINRAPFGHGTVGLEAAAPVPRAAGAQPHPGPDRPAGGHPPGAEPEQPSTDLPRARTRQREVLTQLHETGVIDAATLAEALAEPIQIQRREVVFAAPHFTAWALARDPAPGDVQTTLDLDLQHAVEDAIA